MSGWGEMMKGGGLIGYGIGFSGIGHNFGPLAWFKRQVEDVPGWEGNATKDINALASIILSSCAYLVEPGFL